MLINKQLPPPHHKSHNCDQTHQETKSHLPHNRCSSSLTSKDYRDTSYRLVILGADWDLYEMAYSDLITHKSTYIPGTKLKGKCASLIYRILFSPKINSIISLPNKSIWNWYFFRQTFKSLKRKTPTVFIFFKPWFDLSIKSGLIESLHKNFKNCKTVLFFQDIIASYQDPLTGKTFDIEKYRDKFDLIISFDQQDSRRFGLKYHNTILSNHKVPIQQQYKNDVFFIGKDKGRLPLVYEVFKKLTAYNLSCKFILLDVPEDKHSKYPGMTFIDRLIPYNEVLNYVRNCSCLLEIMQHEAVGATYRTLETISYDKILLSNNQALRNSDLFNESTMYLFDKADDISDAVISAIKVPPHISADLKNKIRPESLISFIESELGIKIEI